MLGRGRHKITQPANTVSSSMIILLQLIVKQKVMVSSVSLYKVLLVFTHAEPSFCYCYQLRVFFHFFLVSTEHAQMNDFPVRHKPEQQLKSIPKE